MAQHCDVLVRLAAAGLLKRKIAAIGVSATGRQGQAAAHSPTRGAPVYRACKRACRRQLRQNHIADERVL